MENQHLSPLTILFIKQGELEVGLLPELGGSIAFAKFNNIDFMRPWNGERTPRKTACYPLAPFSNRITNGQFTFAGQHYQLAKNFGDHPHTIHGVAWQRAWQVIEYSKNKATLFYQHDPNIHGQAAWPFAFSLTQRFVLSSDSLSVNMLLENRESFPIPAGLGWHPFFPRHDEALLQFTANQVVLNDETMLPQKIMPIPSEWDFNKQKPLGEPRLDNCFVNWQNHATIEWPKKNLSLALTSSKTLPHLVVMTPSAPLNHFFAVEPVSHINNAINSPDPQKQGIHFLAKGDTLSVWMRLLLKRQLPLNH